MAAHTTPSSPSNDRPTRPDRPSAVRRLLSRQVSSDGPSSATRYSGPTRGVETTPWSDDDADDDSASDLEAEVERRIPDYSIFPEESRERYLAFARGRVAAATRRVPSKEALAALEKVNLEDLAPADRSQLTPPPSL